jgi:hypothetical protein
MPSFDDLLLYSVREKIFLEDVVVDRSCVLGGIGNLLAIRLNFEGFGCKKKLIDFFQCILNVHNGFVDGICIIAFLV